MRKFILALSIAWTTLSTQAQSRVVTQWTVDGAKLDSPLERFQLADVSGLTVDGEYFYVGTRDGLQRRFVRTGEVDWTRPLDGISRTTWALAAGDLFGGDTKGNLYSVRAETGDVKWKVSTKGVFYSKALIQSGIISVMTSLGTLQAYDLSGQWLWQQPDPKATSVSLWSAQGPIEFQGSVLAGFPSSLLQAFDPKTGKLAWKESFASDLMAGLESFNDLKSVRANSEYLVASSYSGDLRAWKTQGAAKKLVWEKRISLYAPVTLAEDGTLYLSGRDGSVQAIELDSGFVKWKYELPRGLGTQPALVGEKVWVGTSSGEVFVFSNSGTLLAKTESYDSSIWTPPVALNSDEALVMTSRDIIRRLRISSF